MAILSLAGAQFLLRPFTLSNVNHSTDELNQIARHTEHRMTSAVNVPDDPTPMHDSIFSFNVQLLADCPLRGFLKLHSIVGMNPLEQFFDSGQTIPRVETENA